MILKITKPHYYISIKHKYLTLTYLRNGDKQQQFSFNDVSSMLHDFFARLFVLVHDLKKRRGFLVQSLYKFLYFYEGLNLKEVCCIMLSNKKESVIGAINDQYFLLPIFFFYLDHLNRTLEYPLEPMGVLAPWSAHA